MFADDWLPIRVKQMDMVGPSASSGQAHRTSTLPSWSAKEPTADNASSLSRFAIPADAERECAAFHDLTQLLNFQRTHKMAPNSCAPLLIFWQQRGRWERGAL